MLTYVLVGLIAFVAIFNKPAEMRALILFAGMCTGMLIIGREISASNFHYYYTLCALSHLIVLYEISREPKITNFIFRIYIINLTFIYFNLFGFTANFFYIEPLYYNIGCEVLYSLVLVAVINNWYCDGLWTTGISRIISFFRGDMRSSLPQLLISEKEERA